MLLDLTEALAKHLKSLDTTDQRSIMIKKYDLLSARVNARSNEEMSELTRKALEEGLNSSFYVISVKNGLRTIIYKM